MKSLSALLLASIIMLAACNNGTDKPVEQQDATPETPNEQPAVTTADDAHGHTHGDNKTGVTGGGPHKGLVVDGSNGYHVEMLFNGSDAVFYPLDANANAIDINGWSGNATVQQDGKTKSVDLAQRGGTLVAANLNTGDGFKAVVTLKKGEATTSATFDHASPVGHGPESDHGHDHGDGKPHTH